MPVAVNLVGETNVVANFVVPQFTTAPRTNPVPEIARLKLAGDWKLSGVTAIILGIGFSIVTELLPEAEPFVMLVALIFTTAELGRVSGDW